MHRENFFINNRLRAQRKGKIPVGIIKKEMRSRAKALRLPDLIIFFSHVRNPGFTRLLRTDQGDQGNIPFGA